MNMTVDLEQIAAGEVRPRPALRLSGRRLVRELAVRGLTQAELAQLAGVSEVTLSRAKSGRPIRVDTLVKLARALMQTPIQRGNDRLLDG